MTWKLIDEDEGRTYVLVASPGEEAIESLMTLARAEKLSAAQLTAVGAFAHATVGWFDRDNNREIPIDQQCEVISLVGDIVLSDGGPSVHAHAVLGLPDGQVRGGHLLKATFGRPSKLSFVSRRQRCRRPITPTSDFPSSTFSALDKGTIVR